MDLVEVYCIIDVLLWVPIEVGFWLRVCSDDWDLGVNSSPNRTKTTLKAPPWFQKNPLQ